MIPQTEQALLEKAQSIAGLTFGELADELNIPVPPDLKRDKGWVGMLLETALGATAGSKAEQDFSHLGIELKTLPINAEGFPLETTFVSLAPLVQNSGVNWENSHVRHKLSKVLLKAIEIFLCVSAILVSLSYGNLRLNKNINYAKIGKS